jgi:hypothetical protein
MARLYSYLEVREVAPGQWRTEVVNGGDAAQNEPQEPFWRFWRHGVQHRLTNGSLDPFPEPTPARPFAPVAGFHREKKVLNESTKARHIGDPLSPQPADPQRPPMGEPETIEDFARRKGLTVAQLEKAADNWKAAHSETTQRETTSRSVTAAPRVVLNATEFLIVSKTAVTPQEITELERVLALARVRLLYRKQLEAVELPAGGFTNEKQFDAANQVSSTYVRLVKLEKELDLPLTEKDARVTEARRLSTAYRNVHQKPEPVSSRPRRAPQGSRMRNQRLSMMQGLAAAKPHRR